MYKSDAVNFLTAFFAVIFSILLVIFSFVTVLVGSVSSLIKPDTVADVITSVDYDELILDNETVDDIFDEFDMDDEAVNEIMQSDVVKELIEGTTDGIYSVLMGDENAKLLSEDDIIDIFDDNIDEILDIVEEYSPEEIDRDEIEDELRVAINENASEIVSALPKTEDISNEMTPEVELITEIVVGPTLTVIFGGISLVLALIIFALRHRRCGGLTWIGTAGIISSILMLFTTVGIKALDLDNFTDIDTMSAGLINSIVSVLADKMIIALCITLVISVVCIAVSTIVKSVTSKKEVYPVY